MQNWPSKFHLLSFQSSKFQFCHFSPLSFKVCQFILLLPFCQVMLLANQINTVLIRKNRMVEIETKWRQSQDYAVDSRVEEVGLGWLWGLESKLCPLPTMLFSSAIIINPLDVVKVGYMPFFFFNSFGWCVELWGKEMKKKIGFWLCKWKALRRFFRFLLCI